MRASRMHDGMLPAFSRHHEELTWQAVSQLARRYPTAFDAYGLRHHQPQHTWMIALGVADGQASLIPASISCMRTSHHMCTGSKVRAPNMRSPAHVLYVRTWQDHQ
jgi:hypothetical protein